MYPSEPTELDLVLPVGFATGGKEATLSTILEERSALVFLSTIASEGGRRRLAAMRMLRRPEIVLAVPGTGTFNNHQVATEILEGSDIGEFFTRVEIQRLQELLARQRVL